MSVARRRVHRAGIARTFEIALRDTKQAIVHKRVVVHVQRVVKHSTSGWVFMLNEAAISWGSKKQKSVALSSCEAEIMAASAAAQELISWSEGFLRPNLVTYACVIDFAVQVPVASERGRRVAHSVTPRMYIARSPISLIGSKPVTQSRSINAAGLILSSSTA